MLIRELIEKLQEIQNSYSDEDVAIFGEPDIYIDVFSKVPNSINYEYSGISNDVVVERTRDGVCLVLSAFANSQNRK